MADRSWLEFSDDDGDDSIDSEEARRRIDERLRRRKEEAEKLSAPSAKCLQRSVTVGGNSRNRLPAVESRAKRKTRKAPVSNCYGLDAAPSSFSSPSSVIPERIINGQYPAHLNVKEISLSRPTEPSYRIEDNDVVFAETFDIWYTDPSALSNRGTSKDMYDHACCYVGSFNRISEFYAFHNAIDWATIPDGSVVAYTKKDIKPQWEDTMNAYGGRFMFKHFPRQQTEHVFTKIALGFLSGLLSDWHHFNLVSLHIRSSSRGSDIQLWRRIPSGNTGMNANVVMGDIKALLLADASDAVGANATVTWMPNSGSMQRNDHRINHFRQKKQGLTHATSLDTGIKLAQDELLDAWGSSSSCGGSGILSDEMRKAMIAAADAELSKVTPAGAGLNIAADLKLPALTEPSIKFKEVPASPTSTISTVDSPVNRKAADSPQSLPRTEKVVGCKPRRFCFSHVADLLPPKGDSTSACSEAESVKSATKATLSRGNPSRGNPSRGNPYPAYDAPLSMQAWHRGQALKEKLVNSDTDAGH